MRNQKAINVEKFERIRWKQRNGVFKGEAEISRKPFGSFTVTFEINSKNGMTGVEVRNLDYPTLYWARTYPEYKQAVEGVKKRFDETAELIKSIQEDNEKLLEEFRQRISEAIGAALLGKEQLEENSHDESQERAN